MEIRPVSDLRNNFSEIEELVKEGDPVYLTKNGRSSMVVMSMDSYQSLAREAHREWMQRILDEADRDAAENKTRYSHDDMFEMINDMIERKFNEKL